MTYQSFDLATTGARRKDAWLPSHVLGEEDPGMDCIP